MTNDKKTLFGFVAALLVAWFIVADVRAAEIQLRADAKVSGSVITLGDIADIYGLTATETSRLASLELTAAPAPGNRTRLSVREVQDLITLRQSTAVKHQFSGAALVTVVRGDGGDQKTGSRRLSKQLVAQAEQSAADAITRYLRTDVADESWQATVQLSSEQATVINQSQVLAADGGREPWVGAQSFELTLSNDRGRMTLPVSAQVSLPPAVVVAVHPVPRGAVVRASDIEIQRLPPGSVVKASFQTADDVVGKEAVKPISVGQTLDDNSVRPSLMVHGGEVVTVVARNAGIAIRMPVRCRENGALGDLVTVESLTERKSLLARVSGMQEVEVYGGAAVAAAAADTK